MQTCKIIQFDIIRPEDYKPIPKTEKKRIHYILMREVFSIAKRFDGTATFQVHISAKGNV